MVHILSGYVCWCDDVTRKTWVSKLREKRATTKTTTLTVSRSANAFDKVPGSTVTMMMTMGAKKSGSLLVRSCPVFLHFVIVVWQ